MKCLVQLLFQLLTFSIKCTDEGEVGIKVSLVSSEECRAQLHIEVFDTGAGMTEEVNSFPFFFFPFLSFFFPFSLLFLSFLFNFYLIFI